jgi:uncharacterized membrane protein
MMYLLAFAVGILAGFRAMTAPAAVSWAAHLGYLDLSRSWLSFLGYTAAPWIMSALALGEIVTDQLPGVPDRRLPGPFLFRIASGAFCGAAIGTESDSWFPGFVAGGVGAVFGTFGSAAFRRWLASRLHRDRPAAVLEDAVDVGGAVLLVLALA